MLYTIYNERCICVQIEDAPYMHLYTILCKIQYYLHIRKHRKQIDGIKEYGKNKTFSVSCIYGISSQKVPLLLLHAYDIKKWYKQTDVLFFGPIIDYM